MNSKQHVTIPHAALQDVESTIRLIAKIDERISSLKSGRVGLVNTLIKLIKIKGADFTHKTTLGGYAVEIKSETPISIDSDAIPILEKEFGEGALPLRKAESWELDKLAYKALKKIPSMAQMIVAFDSKALIKKDPRISIKATERGA